MTETLDEPRDPTDPVSAVTHRDPYPYYARLVAERPLYRDEALGLWVAASAAAVTAVLTHPDCRVRPPAEPVPRAIAGSPAGEIFRHLVRMNDGAGALPVQARRGGGPRLDRRKGGRGGEPPVGRSPRRRGRFRLPAPRLRHREPARRPGGEAGADGGMDARFRGGHRAGRRGRPSGGRQLRGGFPAGAVRSRLGGADGLLAALARQAGRPASDLIVANGIGFLSQGYESTAGLIGNTLLALAARPDLYDWVRAEPGRMRGVIREVLRYDSPVQNTRRFLAQAAEVAGQEMQAGDAVLVLLAAANRDPAANPDPHRFAVARPDRRTFSGGAGVHACPGQELAVAIAAAGVEQLLLAAGDPTRWREPAGYRPSGNVRVPLWA